MVEALSAFVEAGQAVEAETTIARVDGLAEGASSQEIDLLEAGGVGWQASGTAGRALWTGCANFFGQAHLHNMTVPTAFDHAQDTFGSEAAHGDAHSAAGEANTAGEPGNREAEAGLAFETTVAQEMGIDGAVSGGKCQPGNEGVFELLPNALGVGLFLGVHVEILL